MGRPPCCDKVGVKKGPWTPEEDIMLVSFVQEHGPGNWRSVPTHTGLRRCSKSCRLRWTNYLRPGIKRGSFTDDEEKMIIQLQALLGNKWAAIASYLPERTDNDIKNYWNTHLKKKLKKLQESPLAADIDRQSNIVRFSNSHSIPRDQWEKTLQTDINKAKQALHDALSVDHKPSLVLNPANYYCSGSSYASSTDNIARLLKGWVKNSPNSHRSNSSCQLERSLKKANMADSTSSEGTDHDQCAPKNSSVDLSEALESLFGFESFDSSNSDLSQTMSPEASLLQAESKPELEAQFPLSMLENWLFDEGVGVVVGQGKENLTTNFLFDENADLF